MLKFLSNAKDNVIDGFVIQAETNYQFALTSLVPLMSRLDIQRDVVSEGGLYKRLEEDIITGCIMPSISIALLFSPNEDTVDENTDGKANFSFVEENISHGFVLDGIQRLNTLIKASKNENFDATRPLYVNFILAPSRDRLLYRMITLNNGQRPMSTRHQIEILADVFFDFSEVGVKLVSEKGKSRIRAPGAFKKSDFVQGYTAYLSDSVNTDNQKIIQTKMDELIATRIIDSKAQQIDFTNVIDVINTIDNSKELNKWIRVQNNFIGFCAGIKSSIAEVSNEPLENLEISIGNFEKAFSSIDVSKVKLGKVRRECVYNYIKNFKELNGLNEFDLLNKLTEWV